MNPLQAAPKRVKICEVGPRDGLQNESAPVSARDKIRYIDLLSRTGERLIETTSFVSPKAIPQMADAAEVMAGIERAAGVTYLVLVPNLRGLARAAEAGAKAVAVFTAASESFTKRNINMTIDESLHTFKGVVAEARAAGMWVRGYVSTAFGCPYEGRVPVDAVARAHGRRDEPRAGDGGRRRIQAQPDALRRLGDEAGEAAARLGDEVGRGLRARE